MNKEKENWAWILGGVAFALGFALNGQLQMVGFSAILTGFAIPIAFYVGIHYLLRILKEAKKKGKKKEGVADQIG